MKKQQKKKKLVIYDFGWLKSTYVCDGTITKCQITNGKKVSTFNLTLKVLPKNTDLDECTDDIADYYEHTFSVDMNKKYSPEEEILVQKYLTDMYCSFNVNYDDEEKDLAVFVTPSVSPICLLEVLFGQQIEGHAPYIN